MSWQISQLSRHSTARITGLLRTGLGAASPRLLRRIQVARAHARYRRPPERGPECLQVELASGCNHRCLMCPMHSPYAVHRTPSRMIPWEHLARVLPQAAAMGTEWVWFVGRGEPTLHPRFVDAVGLASSLGLATVVTTNGSLLDDARAEAVCEAGLSHLSISINSGSAATYASVHGAPAEERGRLLAMIRRIADRPHPPTLMATMVVMQANAGEVLAFVQEAIQAGVVEVGLSALRRSYTFPMLVLEDGTAAEQQVAAARVLAEQAGVALRAFGFPPDPREAAGDAPPVSSPRAVGCFIGYQFARLDTEGDVHGCDMGSNPLGNAFATSLQEVWQSPSYQRFRDVGRQMPRTRIAPAGCHCEECGHLGDMLPIYHALNSRPVRLHRPGRYATQLAMAQMVWERFGDQLPSDGESIAYLDLSSAEAGAAWAAVSGLSAAGVMTGVPAARGQRRFLPWHTMRGEQLADLLQHVLTLLGVPPSRRERLIAAGAPRQGRQDILLHRDAVHWVRTVGEGLTHRAHEHGSHAAWPRLHRVIGEGGTPPPAA